jgi:hypothetical protein
MIDNDYRLPSYISPSDRPIIPGLNYDDLPGPLADLLRGNASSSTDPLPETATNSTDFKRNLANSSSSGSGSGSKSDDGWLETPEAIGSPEGGKYPILAIDCEMVGVKLIPSPHRRIERGDHTDFPGCDCQRSRVGTNISHRLPYRPRHL